MLTHAMLTNNLHLQECNFPNKLTVADTTSPTHNKHIATLPCKIIKVKGDDIALCGKPISEIRSVTYCTGSRSVTCHPTQVNTPHLNPSQRGRFSIYLPQRDERLS